MTHGMLKLEMSGKYFLGKKHTPESLNKMSISQKKKWERIKADPILYAQVRARISANHARPSKGKFGPDSTGWKGGRYTTKRDKYIYIWAPNHPHAKRGGGGGGGYVLEHRLIMEKTLGRYLDADEDVNHINGVKDDNRPENLILVRHNAHYSINECPKCNYTWRTR